MRCAISCQCLFQSYWSEHVFVANVLIVDLRVLASLTLAQWLRVFVDVQSFLFHLFFPSFSRNVLAMGIFNPVHSSSALLSSSISATLDVIACSSPGVVSLDISTLRSGRAFCCAGSWSLRQARFSLLFVRLALAIVPPQCARQSSTDDDQQESTEIWSIR